MDIADPLAFLRSWSSRSIHLWGASPGALSLARRLERLGFAPQAFVDSNPSLIGGSLGGLPVLDPRELLAQGPSRAALILVSDMRHEEMAEECLAAGLCEADDFIAYRQLQPFDFFVDVSGYCNLRCLSCPRGNLTEQPKGGFMSLETFRRVVDKIVREVPLSSQLSVYNWNEPLLNPELPDMIAYIRDQGLLPLLSSNLNTSADFREVIKARPHWFRVSTSGWGENYGVVHRGGNWERLLANMSRLRQWRGDYCPEMEIELYFHVYRHNYRQDRTRIKVLSEELGFRYREILGLASPLNNVSDIVEGKALTADMNKSRELLLVDPQTVRERMAAERGIPCVQANHLAVSWDLKVEQCSIWMTPSRPLAEDFLAAPLSELKKARQTSLLCGHCRSLGLHRYDLIAEKLTPEILANMSEAVEVDVLDAKQFN